MFRIPKSVLSFGAGALALGVLTLAASRAAHAFAATLVQVTNTAANPAVTQSPNSQAAQLVNLIVETQTGTFGFHNVLPTGGSSEPYVIPSSQYLVITGADLKPTSCPTGASVSLVVPNTQLALQHWTVSGTNTTHFDYLSGIAIAPGSTPSASVDANDCALNLQLHGYLTSN